jgi:two-component system cell cycle response regulator DivK
MTLFQNVNILIIEDDETSVFVLQNLLEQVGIVAKVILHSPTIFDEIRAVSDIDVIFLDLEMPFLNGYEILTSIKSLPKFQNIPVIAYTTHTSHMSEARVAGFNGFLGKPLNRQRFASQIARILQGEDVWEVS